MAKGALSMMLPVDPADPNVQNYTRAMGDLASSIKFDPADEKRDQWAAFGAGLTSRGDQAGALGRGMAAELEQRNKANELKMHYVPLVMNALNQQAQQQQAMMQQGVLAAVLSGGIENLTPTQLGIIKTMGVDLKDLYELGKFGKNVAAGSSNLMTNGDVNTAPDLKTGMYAKNGVAMPIQNAAGINAYQDALTQFGKNAADAQFKETNVLGPGNQPGTMPLDRRLGLGTPGGPQPPTLQQFGVTPPGNAPAAPVPQSAPAPQPQGNVQTAAGAQNGPAPVSSPQPAASSVPTRVSVADQAARDKDVMFALQSELQKTLQGRAEAMKTLVAAQQTGDQAKAMEAQDALHRYNQDVAGISREIQRAGGKPPVSLEPTASPAPGNAPATSPAAASGAPAGFVPTDMSTQQKAGVKANENLNEDWIKNAYRPAQEAASSAKALNASISSARQAVSRLPDDAFGRFGEFKKNYSEMLGAMGVKNADKVATDYQQFQQAAQNRLWEVLNQAKGPQTEGDAERAKQTFIRLGNTRAANEFMLDFAQAANELAIKKANFYRDMRDEGVKAGNMSMIDDEWGRLGKSGAGLSVWDAPIMKRWRTKE